MNVVVVGQGYVGLPIAVAAAKVGFKVYGFDTDVSKIKDLKSGITNSPEVKVSELIELQELEKIIFVTKIPIIADPTIFVIAVPTPLDENLEPDLTMLKSACDLISTAISHSSLVINESTSFIGTLNRFIKPTIESSTSNLNLDFAVAPERIDPGNKQWNLKQTPRIISGVDEQSTQRAFDFYSSFCDHVHIVSKPEVAEAAKLLENTFRQVNIGLINEFSNIAQKYNVSANEIVSAASTKPYGYMPFYPSIGVGGHCIPVDPTYFVYSATQVGTQAEITSISNKINSNMPMKVVSRILLEFGGSIKGKLIQIAGITYKPNVNDLRESPALILIELLEAEGAEIIWHDPFVGIVNEKVSRPLTSKIDLGLIVTPHDQINFSIWKNENVKVLDLSANSNDYGWPKFL